MCAAAQQNFYLTTKLSQVTSPGSESTELTLKTLLDEQQRETQHLLDEQRRLRGVAEESQGQNLKSPHKIISVVFGSFSTNCVIQ